jgi:hypothetical protein
MNARNFPRLNKSEMNALKGGEGYWVYIDGTLIWIEIEIEKDDKDKK